MLHPTAQTHYNTLSLFVLVNKMYHSKYEGVTNCARIFTYSSSEIYLQPSTFIYNGVML